MHKLFEITNLTNIIADFVYNRELYCPIFPTNNDELYLCNVFETIIITHNNDLQKMENYHYIKNLEITGEISLFPKRLKCLYVSFRTCYEKKNTEYPVYPANISYIQDSQKDEKETKKIVSWLESIYETLPSSLTFIGFEKAKKKSVMLKLTLPKSIKYLNIDNGSIVNNKILTQLTTVMLSNNESIDGLPDNIETIKFINKICQQKITKLPKNLKTIDLYANKNHPFKCKKYKNYDDHHKSEEFVHNETTYGIHVHCEEHDFIYTIPNIRTIVANACIFNEDQIKIPEKLDKLIIYECTCGSINEFYVREYIKDTNIVFEFRKNVIRNCG